MSQVLDFFKNVSENENKILKTIKTHDLKIYIIIPTVSVDDYLNYPAETSDFAVEGTYVDFIADDIINTLNKTYENSIYNIKIEPIKINIIQSDITLVGYLNKIVNNKNNKIILTFKRFKNKIQYLQIPFNILDKYNITNDFIIYDYYKENKSKIFTKISHNIDLIIYQNKSHNSLYS